MTDYPPGYLEATEAMAEAARAWLISHPSTCLVLNPPDPDNMGLPPSEVAKMKAIIAAHPGERMGIIAGLNDVIKWWGGNEDTKELLRVMDRASGNKATYNQACAVLHHVFDSVGQA